MDGPSDGSVKLLPTCEDYAGCPHVAVRRLVFTKALPAPGTDYPMLDLCEGHVPLWASEGHRRGYLVWSADIYGKDAGRLSQI